MSSANKIKYQTRNATTENNKRTHGRRKPNKNRSIENDKDYDPPVNAHRTMDQDAKPVAKNAKKTKRKSEKPQKIIFEPAELEEALICTICKESFHNNIDFAIHSRTHSEDGKYSCHFCDYKTTCKYRTEAHVRGHEGTSKKYKCSICNKTFRKSTYAVEHKYFHTGERPFQCEICGKHFMYSKSLAHHRRTTHYEVVTGQPLRKFDCIPCNKHYESQSGLLRHNSMYHRDPNSGGGLSVLCDICGKRLSCKYKLKFHMRTHTGYKPFCCRFCSKAFTNKDQVVSHERVHTGEKPFSCEFCGKAFAQSAPYRYHVKTHTGDRKYMCPLCNKTFISKSNMRIHIKTCNTIVKKEVNLRKRKHSISKTKKQKEDLEPEIDEKSRNLKNLMKIEEVLKCESCSNAYSNHEDLALHSKTHSKNRHYTCHLCNFEVSSKFRIERHIRGHRGYKCEICNKVFRKVSSALKHSYIHSGEKPYQCEICGKHLSNAKSLDMHLNTIHHEILTGLPLVKYDCVVCKKHYESETGLRRHYSSMHKELGIDLSVICEICGKRISNTTRLKRHMRTHTGYKPYPCLVCSRSFATKCLLTSHTRVHTGEKPFVCTFCGKRFGQSAPYRYHVKIHTGERKYTCKICGKGFISNSNLKIHMKSCNVIIKT